MRFLDRVIAYARCDRHDAGAFVALTFFGVFVLPWFVPLPAAEIQSESLAVGFNNRVAMVALCVSALTLFGLARLRSGNRNDEPSLISVNAAPAHERVSRWFLVTMVVVTLAAVALQALVLQSMPHGDAMYFVDRMMHAVAGETPWVDFEFSYGPILFFGPWVLWRLLNPLVGLELHDAYYIWVAFCYVLGLVLTTHLLDRVHMSRVLRNGSLALVTVMTLANNTLGVNLSALRFLLPYALLVWTVGRLTRPCGRLMRWGGPLATVVLAAAVSPEMGVALMVALAVTLFLLAIHNRGRHLGALLVFVGVGALSGVTALLARGGTFDAFAGGAYSLPVLPGPPVSFFVGTALLVAWGVGRSLGSLDEPDSALQMGWLALLAVLVIPTFSRADFIHVFWNGLGAIIVGIAVARRYWRVGGAYLAVAAAVFVVAMAMFSWTYSAKPIAEAARRTLYSSQERADRVSELRGKPLKSGRRLWMRLDKEKRAVADAAARLEQLPNVAFAALLYGEVGERLAAADNLIPLCEYPGNALTAAGFHSAVAQLDEADHLVIPTSEYVAYKRAGRRARPNANGVVMTTPSLVGGPQWFGILQGVPVSIPGRNPVFDPVASFGVVMKRDWYAYDTLAGYTLLVRNPHVDSGR